MNLLRLAQSLAQLQSPESKPQLPSQEKP